MKCPACQSLEFSKMEFHAEGFNEEIAECKTCDTVWSVNHGLVEVVKDSHPRSILAATCECVEGDDYYMLVA